MNAQSENDPNSPNAQDEYHLKRLAALYENAGSRFRLATEIALQGLRSLLIAHGGALVAIFAFLAQGSAPVGLTDALGWFAGGVCLALVASLFAYLCQSAYANQDAFGADKIYFHNVANLELSNESGRGADAKRDEGLRWEYLAIGSVVLSLVCAVIGGVVVNCAFTR